MSPVSGEYAPQAISCRSEAAVSVNGTDGIPSASAVSRSASSIRRSISAPPAGVTRLTAGRDPSVRPARLRDRDRVAQVDVLNRVQQLDSVAHRPLKRLAPADQPGATG